MQSCYSIPYAADKMVLITCYNKNLEFLEENKKKRNTFLLIKKEKKSTSNDDVKIGNFVIKKKIGW